MAYIHQRYAVIGIGVTLIMMILGSDGALTMSPRNRAVLSGTSRVSMSCASDYGYQSVSWRYVPVGGSSVVVIASGSTVFGGELNQSYAVEQTGSQQSDLIILSATMARAGTYSCLDITPQQAFAQLIVINSDPVCSMTPNAPTELLYNETVQMSCSVIYTANTSYVGVDMIWSKGSPATIVTSAPPNTTTSSNLTTAVSIITQVPGNFTPFPIFSCNTSFKVTGNPPASANNAPDYSKSTPLFSSPINVIYLKPADASSITGAKDGQVQLGTTVTCNVDANPTPSYSWLDVTNKNTTNTSTIQIWHSGEYQCTAWNRAASTSTSINVTTFTTSAAPTTVTTTILTTTVTSRSASPSGSDTIAPQAASGNDGLSETNKIIVGVVVGVGGALLIVAITILICCCLKKNKADKYSGSREGTLSKPPPYEDGGHRGPQRSTNPDLVQGGYPMDEYSSKDLSSPYSTTSHHDRPYIDEDGLNYAQIQLDNNPRSRQPLQVAEGTNYSDVRLA